MKIKFLKIHIAIAYAHDKKLREVIIEAELHI